MEDCNRLEMAKYLIEKCHARIDESKSSRKSNETRRYIDEMMEK